MSAYTIASRLHILYNGELPIIKKHLFTDPQTHDTFTARDYKEAKAKLIKERKAWLSSKHTPRSTRCNDV